VGPRNSLDAVEAKENSCSYQEQNLGHPTRSPSLHRLSYPGSIIIMRTIIIIAITNSRLLLLRPVAFSDSELILKGRIHFATGSALRALEHWDRRFESPRGMDVCVCVCVCVLYR
jgi:hypothetical protein